MKIDMTQSEVQICLNGLKYMRTQQELIGKALKSIDPEQVRRGIKLVTDLEDRLSAHLQASKEPRCYTCHSHLMACNGYTNWCPRCGRPSL